jgi:hypothetical protein
MYAEEFYEGMIPAFSEMEPAVDGGSKKKGTSLVDCSVFPNTGLPMNVVD